jgi:hypothetical protein
MRGNIVGLLAAALMAVCGVASANIIYNVDISGGGEEVKGTITTDGASGPLVAADFVSWSLTASGGINFVDGGPPPGANCGGLGCGVAVVGGEIAYTGGVSTFVAFGDIAGTSIDFGDASVDVHGLGPGDVVHIQMFSPYAIGSASVPEPPTAILLGIGLACLGLAYKRAPGRQSAAV